MVDLPLISVVLSFRFWEVNTVLAQSLSMELSDRNW
jgi:hypothetical protein